MRATLEKELVLRIATDEINKPFVVSNGDFKAHIGNAFTEVT